MSQILGVVLLVRGGDRLGLYQSPPSYTETASQITPLGNQQEYQLGGLLQSIYLNSSSSSYIPGMSTGLFNPAQVSVRADMGGEGGVTYDSCVSLTQGLWPASGTNSVTLANGTTITAPNGGYQNVPINAVDPNLDVSLEGYSQCNALNGTGYGSGRGYHHHHFGQSGPQSGQGQYGDGPQSGQGSPFGQGPPFGQISNQSAAFLSLLPPYLDGRPATFDDIWNVYDYMNVNNIHNATYAQNLPATYLEQARALADIHEYFLYTDRSISGIGNIAGQTMLPGILNAFNGIVDPNNSVKMSITAISYKPFLSLFQMTGVTAANSQLAGIVDYASAVAFEVRQPSGGGEPVIRFNFKNGTADFATYNYMGQTGDVPLSTFINTVSPYTVNTTAEWCSACQNTQGRGCGALTLAAQQARSAAASPLSHVGAGLLGAGLAIALIAIALAALAYRGRLHFVRKPRTAGELPVIEEDEEAKDAKALKAPSKRSSMETLVQK